MRILLGFAAHVFACMVSCVLMGQTASARPALEPRIDQPDPFIRRQTFRGTKHVIERRHFQSPFLGIRSASRRPPLGYCPLAQTPFTAGRSGVIFPVMKKSPDHLPKRKRAELDRVASIIGGSCDDVEMIILFGS